MSESDPFQRMFNKLSDKVADGAIKAILGLLAMLVRPLATLTEIFVRRDFGERYYTLWNWYGGCVILAIAYYGMYITAGLSSTHQTFIDRWGEVHTTVTEGSISSLSNWTMALWAWGLHILTIVQWWSVRRRYQRGGRWHSRSIGLPWIPRIPAWVERVILLVAGICLIRFGAVIPGALMMASASTTILLRWHEARAFRNRVLDVIDDQIDQECLAKAVMERAKPQDVDGLRAPLPAYVSTKFREKVIEAFGSARPQLPGASAPATAYNTPAAASTPVTPSPVANTPMVGTTASPSKPVVPVQTYVPITQSVTPATPDTRQPSAPSQADIPLKQNTTTPAAPPDVPAKPLTKSTSFNFENSHLISHATGVKINATSYNVNKPSLRSEAVTQPAVAAVESSSKPAAESPASSEGIKGTSSPIAQSAPASAAESLQKINELLGETKSRAPQIPQPVTPPPHKIDEPKTKRSKSSRGK